MTSNMKLRVTGLGHSLTLDMESGATIGELKTEIECQTTIPALYQRLLARGKKLDLDDLTLEEVGMKDRTKIMLMRNALYSKEKEGFERLSALAKEIDELKTKKETVADNVVSEMVTRMCCKLDAIETMGSENLRALRKELLRKAENIDS